jgi:hypothetical protein
MLQPLKASPLPYTMGNSGDLIKHGLLAEFIAWHIQNIDNTLKVYDPFGGRPWQAPIHPEVLMRLNRLESCGLKSSQNSPDVYFGSGHIIRHLNQLYSANISVLTSDRDETAREDLHNTGLPLIKLNGFEPGNAWTILSAKRDTKEASLIILDPFYELEYINQSVLPKIQKTVTNTPTSVALYVLYEEKEKALWAQFQKLNQSLSESGVRSVSLECKAVANSSIKGESKFHSYVILYMASQYSAEKLNVLRKNISVYADNLQSVIKHPICCDSQNVTTSDCS